MRLRRTMAEKPKVFEATSEEDTCNGFEENVINSQMKAMVSYKEKHNRNIFQNFINCPGRFF